jgi:hypothetical protein
MRLSILITYEVPLSIQFLQGPFALIKHKVLYLLSPFTHRRELLINLDQLHSKLILANNPN